jgi:hypothetical protein
MSPARRLGAALLVGMGMLGLVGCDPGPRSEGTSAPTSTATGTAGCAPTRGEAAQGTSREVAADAPSKARLGPGGEVRRTAETLAKGRGGRRLVVSGTVYRADRGLADQRRGRVRARPGHRRRAVLLPGGGAAHRRPGALRAGDGQARPLQGRARPAARPHPLRGAAPGRRRAADRAAVRRRPPAPTRPTGRGHPPRAGPRVGPAAAPGPLRHRPRRLARPSRPARIP